MGHLSSYTKTELKLQPAGCGVKIGGISTAKCGDRQPDMESWLCPACNKIFEERLKEHHAKN
jgi:hypothetical protein